MNLGSPEYRAFVEALYGFEEVEWWLELGDLLAGRPGWHVDFCNTEDGAELLWSFGSFGSSLFNVTPVGAGEFSLFDYEVDENHLIAGIDSLRGWLEENESRHTDQLAKRRPMLSADDWWMLRIIPFDVRVTVDDARWLGTVVGLPLEVAIATSFEALLVAVRQMLCNAVGAPAELAPVLKMTARLDSSSTAALGGESPPT